MQIIKRILVALDLTEIDKTLIRQSVFLSEVYHPEEIIFVHIEKDYSKLNELHPELKNTNLPVDEKILAELRNEVNTYFEQQTDVQVSFELAEGIPLKEIVKLAEKRKIHLVVVGKKNAKNGSGVVAKKLARVGRFNMLFVPADVKPTIQRILVPIDFSEYSELALKHAVTIAQQLENPEIIVQHVYQVPTGHYKIGKSYEEMAEIMRKSIESKIFSEVNKIPHGNIPIKAEYSLTEHDDFADQILKTMKNKNVDLLVLGAKGQTALSAFLLGSHTEKVLKHDIVAPVMVVKKPKEQLGFLDTVYLES